MEPNAQLLADLERHRATAAHRAHGAARMVVIGGFGVAGRGCVWLAAGASPAIAKLCSVAQGTQPAHIAAAVSRLLRRYMVHTRGSKWAGVRGRAWLVALDKQLGKGQQPLFTSPAGACLLWAPYSHPEQVDKATARTANPHDPPLVSRHRS